MPVPHADKISWKTTKPVWVDQWPLNSEKLAAATMLVQEQLAAGHIEPTTSPWNTPIFVIKKGQENGDYFRISEKLIKLWCLWGLFSQASLPL